MRSAPWQVKGIDPEARYTAREAARRSGVSVGQWLNSVILEQAADEGFPPDEAARRGYPGEDLAAINERLDDLRRQLAQLAEHHLGPGRPADEDTSHRIAAAILRLNGRLDQIIAEGRTASRTLEQRVNGVDRVLAGLSQERLRGPHMGGEAAANAGREAPAPVGGEPAGMDQAVAEIAARQRALDGEFAAPPSAAFQHAARAPVGCRADDAVDGLRKDLADIGRSLSAAMPRHAVEALETEVRALAGRLDAGRQAGVDAAALAGLEQGLREVRDALRGLAPAESLVGFEQAVKALSGKIDTIAAGRDDPAGLRKLEAAISSLRGIVGQVASGDALGALAQEVRALALKIEQGVSASGSPDILRTLEMRIGTIADAIESVRAQSGRAVSPRLDQLVESLNDKLERIQSSAGDQLSRGDQLVLGGLEDRIAKLVEKLDASEGRLGHLAAIERGMGELLVHLEGLRASPPAAASQAGRAEPPLAAPAGAAVPVEELGHDVAELKHAQATVERRTQELLEVVHGAIETVVDRLATIETDIRKDQRGDAPAPSASLPAPPPAPPPAVQPPPVRPSAAASPPSVPAAQRAAGARPAINQSLPHDHPLEPGSGPPRVRPAGSGVASSPANPAASAADRVAASEEPLRAAKGAVAEPESKSGYLQAARRAAQLASQNAGRRELAGATDPEALGSKLSQRLKAVFVGISVAVLIVVALRYAASYLESAELALPGASVLAERSAPEPVVVAAPPSAAPRAALPRTRSPLAVSVERPADPGLPPLAAASPSQAALPFSGVPDIDKSPSQPLVPPAPSALPASADTARDVTGAVPARPTPRNAPTAPAALAHALPATAPAVPGSDQLPAAIGGKALIAAGAAGDPAAAFEIATRYAEGRGVPQNFPEAAVWYERAAKGGLAPRGLPARRAVRKRPGREQGPATKRAGSIWRPPRRATPTPCTISACSTPKASTASPTSRPRRNGSASPPPTASPTASTISRSSMRAASASSAIWASPTNGSRSPPRAATQTPARSATRSRPGSTRRRSPRRAARPRPGSRTGSPRRPLTVKAPAGGWDQAAACPAQAEAAPARRRRAPTADRSESPIPPGGKIALRIATRAMYGLTRSPR